MITLRNICMTSFYLLSNVQSTYVTPQWYFLCIFLHAVFNFRTFLNFILGVVIDFVLSSPKWVFSILPINKTRHSTPFHFVQQIHSEESSTGSHLSRQYSWHCVHKFSEYNWNLAEIIWLENKNIWKLSKIVLISW